MVGLQEASNHVKQAKVSRQGKFTSSIIFVSSISRDMLEICTHAWLNEAVVGQAPRGRLCEAILYCMMPRSGHCVVLQAFRPAKPASMYVVGYGAHAFAVQINPPPLSLHDFGALPG
jgi:hypothetical protein